MRDKTMKVPAINLSHSFSFMVKVTSVEFY